MSFKDHFSGQAADYARYRPQYPRALFQFIREQSPNDQKAMDCATGNGQAALGLAEFFRQVIALDASAQQIANAEPNDRVEYRVASADATGLAEHSCDAVTVAQALHWLNLDRFYAETRRILKPDGILAVWAYTYLRVSPEVDAILRHFHDEIVGPFWPPERWIVGDRYRDLPFPFHKIDAPEFQIETSWTLARLLGYLRTWSATQRYLTTKGRDPVSSIEDKLAQAWGNPGDEHRGIWPMIVRVGRA